MTMPVQVVHIFVHGFGSRVRGGHYACVVLFSHFYVLRVGSDHLCRFPRWLSFDQPYFALCPSMPKFPVAPQRDRGSLGSAILLIGPYLDSHHGCDINQVA